MFYVVGNNLMTNSHDDDDDFGSEHGSSGSAETRNFNFHLLKADNDLFDEDSHVAHTAISAKRINLPNDGEDWEIWEDNQIALSLKGTRFNNAEKKFLRSVEGMKFLVAEYKAGARSVLKLKDKLKQVVNHD
jgi:hypothetical protein